MQDKLEQIAIVQAEQEQQIADLSEMVAQQWREIEGLKDALKQAELRMTEMAAQQSSASAVLAVRMALSGGAEPMADEAAGHHDEVNDDMSVADQARAMKPPHY